MRAFEGVPIYDDELELELFFALAFAPVLASRSRSLFHPLSAG